VKEEFDSGDGWAYRRAVFSWGILDIRVTQETEWGVWGEPFITALPSSREPLKNLLRIGMHANEATGVADTLKAAAEHACKWDADTGKPWISETKTE